MRRIGYGAVAHDVKENEIEAEIVFYPLISGETQIPKTPEPLKETASSISDTAGNLVSGSVKKSQTITCRWLNEAGNQVNMPSLKQGEQVTVYQYGDTDRYYFMLGHREKDLRREETGVFSFSNIPDTKEEFGKHYDKNTSYTLTVDPKNNLVELHTANNNGEAAAYTIKLETDKGIFSIVDSLNNSIKLESTKGLLTVDIPKVIWNGESMTLNGSSTIIMNAPSAIIKGGKLAVRSTVDFFKACNHKAVSIFNGLSKTKPGKCPCCDSLHRHMLE